MHRSSRTFECCYSFERRSQRLGGCQWCANPRFRICPHANKSPRDITCDRMGVYNSKLLCSLIAVDPTLLRPFFFFIKLWASSHGLIDNPNGGFSSYALNLLVLFYFQLLELLPTIEELQKYVHVVLCRNWNVNFNQSKPLDPAFKQPNFCICSFITSRPTSRWIRQSLSSPR